MRLVVFAVCAVGVAGMIAGSVTDSNALALTFGLITVAAVLCLLVATSVAATDATTEPDEDLARRLESGVSDLVAEGADETKLRELVAAAVRLGRGLGEEGRGGVHGGRTPEPRQR